MAEALLICSIGTSAFAARVPWVVRVEPYQVTVGLPSSSTSFAVLHAAHHRSRMFSFLKPRQSFARGRFDVFVGTKQKIVRPPALKAPTRDVHLERLSDVDRGRGLLHLADAAPVFLQRVCVAVAHGEEALRDGVEVAQAEPTHLP